jgi:uncharacterized protein YjbI with pentapeptide repeats
MTNADFSGANLAAATLEDTDLTGAKFVQSNLEGAYFSNSITDAGDLTG